jgi:ATP:ADP antiporter, AAA family
MEHMNDKSFGTIRALLWPVRRGEYKKFIPMFLIAFLVCFNYYFLKIAKDSVLITAPQSGAEAIPFVKVWAILPMAFFMTFIFTRFSNFFNRKNVFYVMIWFYIGYFLFFTFVLYPNRNALHPHELADFLESFLPRGFKGLIALIRNWTFTTFYVMAEMWSTMIMTVLFWGFVNDVTSVKDAKRFYGLLVLGTNVSGVFAGIVAKSFSGYIFHPFLGFGFNAWDQILMFMNLIVVGVALASMVLYWYLNWQGVGYTEKILKTNKEPFLRMGMRKNFSCLAKSKYLTCIAVLVVVLNIVLNLSEVAWKDRVKQLYPIPVEFNAYTAGVTTWSAGIAMFISLFIAGNAIRILGWTKSAMIPPLLTLITGVLFFSAILVPSDYLMGICMYLGTSPISLAVFLGSLQYCFLRGTKNSLVDATKELAFVPLDVELKMKGKAAIDGVGSRLGKSGGALIYQFLVIVFGSIAGTTPVVAFLLLASVVGWIIAVRVLGKQFNELTVDQTVLCPAPIVKANHPLQTLH